MLVFADIYTNWFFVQVCIFIEIVSVDFPMNDLIDVMNTLTQNEEQKPNKTEGIESY